MKHSRTSICFENNVPMETREGTVLRADVIRPDDGGKHPAILIRTPYNKVAMAERDYSFLKIVQAGYAVVFQDTRGRYASEGNYDGGDTFLRQESPDGFDAVEWLAARSWCDGNVGTYGGSYMARVQWLLAKEQPPHLKAMAPSISSDTPAPQATVWYGVISLTMGASSASSVGMDIIDKLEKQGKDVSKIRPLLNQVISNPEERSIIYPSRICLILTIPASGKCGTTAVCRDRHLRMKPKTSSGTIQRLSFLACIKAAGMILIAEARWPITTI